LSVGDIAHGRVPEEPPGLVAADGGVALRGDDTGETLLYAAPVPGGLIVSDEAGALLETVRRERGGLAVSTLALSHAVHDGVVPYPTTIYRDVYALTLGDRLLVRAGGGGLELDPRVEFPYLSARSREDERPDTSRLLDLLSAATAKRIEGASDVLLLLSAGKDSTALALALAECGARDALCVTYTSEGDDEALYAQETCRKLGLRHVIVSLADVLGDIDDALARLFAESPFPPVDLAQIPVLAALRRFGGRGTVVVEGTGNDASFGYVPRPSELRLMRFGPGRCAWVDHLKPAFPVWSRVNYVLRDPAEVNWPALRPRFVDTKRFLRGSVNTSAVWRTARRGLGPLEPIDARGLLRGRHFEIGSQRQKIELAAAALGMHAVYPYQDADVASYYFHLPEPARFDRGSLTNKVLLRRLLRERLDYDEAAIGKRGFRFDGTAFLARRTDAVLAEIGACEILGAAAVSFARRTIRASRTASRAWHAPMALYQIAGWLNHCRYFGTF
jgi:asparagine synthetase B (glutamine-hydrolysing)